MSPASYSIAFFEGILSNATRRRNHAKNNNWFTRNTWIADAV